MVDIYLTQVGFDEGLSFGVTGICNSGLCDVDWHSQNTQPRNSLQGGVRFGLRLGFGRSDLKDQQ